MVVDIQIGSYMNMIKGSVGLSGVTVCFGLSMYISLVYTIYLTDMIIPILHVNKQIAC